MACSFCFSLFLTPFNCFSACPLKSPQGWIPPWVAVTSVPRSSPIGGCSIFSCDFFCVSIHVLSFPSCLLCYLPVTPSVHHFMSPALPSYLLLCLLCLLTSLLLCLHLCLLACFPLRFLLCFGVSYP